MIAFFKSVVELIVKMVTGIVAGIGRVGVNTGQGIIAILPQAKALILGQLIIISTIFLIMAIGLIFNFQSLVVLCALLSGVGFFVFWKVPDMAIAFISHVVGSAPWIGSAISNSCTELRRMIFPLLTTGMSCMFIGSMVAIRGAGYYNYNDFLISITVGTFVFMFLYYIDSRSHWAGYIMMGVIVFTIITYRIAPIQVLALLDVIEGSSIKTGLQQEQESRADTLVKVNAGTPTFTFDFGSFKKSDPIRSEMVVKIKSRKDDPKSKESLYLVILPVSDGVYVNGDEVYIPSRSLPLMRSTVVEKKPEVKIEQPIVTKASSTNNESEAEKIKKNDYQVLDFGTYVFEMRPGQSSVMLEMPKGFYADISPKNKIFQLFSDGVEMPVSETRVTRLPFRLVNKNKTDKSVVVRITRS